MSADDELQLLLDILPPRLTACLPRADRPMLMEVVMDLGRPAEARYRGKRYEMLGHTPVSEEEIAHVTQRIGEFTTDNRAGLPRTLHRISALRNRQGRIVGLTCRVGKAVTGTIDGIKDLLEPGKSLLLLGPPGVGKTTRLREIAKLLADEGGKRVVIVDTSNEIAGDGDIPHPSVGRARRMQVSSPDRQQVVMIEAVENHTPEVIIVDEIGSEEEAQAARTIAERGVMLVATAHGGTLDNLIKNPVLSDLVGGVQAVTLGDDEARRRASQKTVLEREKHPTFDICVEIRDQLTVAVYPDVAEAVDHLLRGWTLFPQVRRVDSETGDARILQTDVRSLPDLVNEAEQTQALTAALTRTGGILARPPADKAFRVFLYGISRAYVDRIIERLSLNSVSTTNNIHDADAIIALRGSARPGSKIAQLAADYEAPIYIAKANTMPHIQRALREAMNAEEGAFAEKLAEPGGETETDAALREALAVAEQVLASGEPVELGPQRSFVRRLQHEIIENKGLRSVSVGDEPKRRLKILPGE